MRNFIYIILLLVHIQVSAQQKGVSPSDNNREYQVPSQTYAVVVGISDYQDPAIPDLKYADKDAEAFANFLRSESGRKLQSDHLKILLNEHATMGQMANALDWLLEVSKENDHVYIYFSGHGDVEKKTLSQPGYLLCWDSPARVYLGGGAMALPMFQDVISTLSIQNKAKVIVISDACHAGKLSGNNINGTQATAANLAKQFANEIKILSCQPNEYSIEGQQWGSGRGAFSYHLIEGLYGLADLNGDKSVSLLEVSRYLEDNVSKEVAPLSQMPLIIGDKSEKLSNVASELLITNKSNKTNDGPSFAATESRGLEDEILSNTDSITKKIFYNFSQSLKNKNFFEPEKNCAEYFYSILSNDKRLVKLHSTMRRNYAAALQDDAQQAINRYMKADVHLLSLSYKNRVTRYSDFPRQLNRAAGLLGVNHYLYRTLLSRSAYFEGFPLIYGGEFTQEMLKKAAAKFHESLQWDPNMPLALLGMAWIHGFGWAQTDSAEYYTHLSTLNSPSWILPYARLSEAFATMTFDFEKSKEYLNRAAQIDSTSPLYWEAEGSFYFEQNRYKEAEVLFKKIIENASSSNCMPCAQNSLVKIYIKTNRMPEALELARKLVISDSSNSTSHNSLGIVLTKMGKYKDAESEFRIAVQLSANQTNHEMAHNYWKSYIFLEQNEIEKAFEAFEKALKLGYDDYSWIQVDPEFIELRQYSKEWNALMKKYFPDKVK